MGDASAGLRRRIRRQVAALGPRGVTSPVPQAIRVAIADYARQRRAAGMGWRAIAREVGFSVGAIQHWVREAPTVRQLRPVALRSAAVVTLPASGIAIVLPSGVRLEHVPVADVPALLAQLP